MTSRTEYCMQTPNKPSLFDVQYLRNHWTLDIGVLGYIGIVWPKEHSPKVRSFPPGTPCIYIYIYILYINVCILYIQYIHTLHVRMPTSGIDIHYIGWGCQSPDPQEIHCFKWEFFVQYTWFFSGMYPWHKTMPACIFIQVSFNAVF